VIAPAKKYIKRRRKRADLRGKIRLTEKPNYCETIATGSEVAIPVLLMGELSRKERESQKERNVG